MSVIKSSKLKGCITVVKMADQQADMDVKSSIATLLFSLVTIRS